MTKLFDPPHVGGLPIYNTDLVGLQQNSVDVLETLLKGQGREGIVVRGLEVTANGGNIDIAPGTILMDGEFWTYDGGVNVANPSYIKALGSVTNSPRVFRDGASKTATVDRPAIRTSSLPTGEQFFTCNRVSDNHYKWHKYTDFYTLNNGWTESAFAPLQFKKNIDGTVSWRGKLNGAGKSSDTFISANNVPEDLRPAATGGFLDFGGTAIATVSLHCVMTQSLGSGDSFSIPGATTVEYAINITYSTQQFI